jgi:hypothetical protein
MPRRYNLRKRDETVKWIEDDTLKETENDSESDDSAYETPSESEESEEVSLVDEDEDEEEEEEPEEEQEPRNIVIPMPKKGMRVKIEIANDYDDDYDEDYEGEDEEDEQDGFLGYLLNKYVPGSRIRNKQKKEKEPDSPALDLNDEEREYFDDLTRSKQKKLNKQMKQIATLVSHGDVPYKFRVLGLPVSDAIKASVIKKIDVLDKMDMDGGESHKLRTWVDGFLRIPFGVNVPLPVKMDDGPKPCAEFLSQTRKTLDSAVYGKRCQDTDHADSRPMDFQPRLGGKRDCPERADGCRQDFLRTQRCRPGAKAPLRVLQSGRSSGLGELCRTQLHLRRCAMGSYCGQSDGRSMHEPCHVL